MCSFFFAIAPLSKLCGFGIGASANMNQLIDVCTEWKKAWWNLLDAQAAMIQNYEIMYNPILGAGETYQGYQAVETPQKMLDRVVALKEAYEELRADMQQELNSAEARIIKPIKDAKQSLQPVRKLIKEREDRRVRVVPSHGQKLC